VKAKREEEGWEEAKEEEGKLLLGSLGAKMD
jgi:hypothetical protein